MSKSTFAKASFNYYFFRYENPRRKNFINPSHAKHPKIIKIKNDIIFIFTLFCGASEKFDLFEAPKKCENKKIMSLFPLITLGKQGLWLHFVEPPTYAISVSVSIILF